MKHLVLLGDSIFDNAGYVDKGNSVIDQLNASLPENISAELLAVDGDVTQDVFTQLGATPKSTTHVFVSCGGNDALRIANRLSEKVSTVADAMEIFSLIKAEFATLYSQMLLTVQAKHSNLSVCTIHDAVPGYDVRALTALAIFNEIILQEAFKLNLPVIDLRIVCDDAADYSPVSPIEPSEFGARKIADRILIVAESHNFDFNRSVVYT